MPRRIEVELTSSREDGSWTWRAAGARQPKGELDGSLLYDGAKVGDIVRADADFAVEGISIVHVLPPKGARREPDRIEIIGPPRHEPGVTTVLAPKGRRDRRDEGGPRGPRGPSGPRRDLGDRRNERGDRGGERGGERGERHGAATRTEGRRRPEGGERREARTRPPRPAPEPRPKPRRLKAGRTHRNEVLATLPDTHKPLAEELIRGGIPGVRQTLERQNAMLKADGKPQIDPDPVLDIAERLTPVLKRAEWRDKAEAALASADEIDIKDLRSVVVAADVAARDEESRSLAEQLRAAVATRVDREHHSWLEEITQNLDEGRVVRALRLSSRPPKAGAPFPGDHAGRLALAAGESLTADISADRYATVLDAVAYSPVRLHVEPIAVPDKPAPELLSAVTRLASRVPTIATRFGVEAPTARPSRSRRGPGAPSTAPPPSAPATPPS